MRNALIAGFALLLTGCATGFNRQAIEQRLADQPIEVTDADIRAVLNRNAQLRFPIKVAVHLVAETYHPRYGGGPVRPDMRFAPDWRWTTADRERIAQWAEPLREAGVVADLYVMSEMVSASGDLKSIRLAAAKHGADVVLLVKGVSQLDSYVNAASVFNLLILPGYVVPASHRDALLLLRGGMWDVGNECLYLSVDAEGEAKTTGPTFLIKDEDARDAAKLAALDSFGAELQKRLLALKGETPGK